MKKVFHVFLFVLFAVIAVQTPLAADISVTADGQSVNMPLSGTSTVNISTGVSSFKVYDDGGSDGDFSNNVNGTLVLKAPSGYVLELTGNIKTGAYEQEVCLYSDLWDGFAICHQYGVNYHCDANDNLSAYDGTNTSATSLLNGVNGCSSRGPTWTSVERIQSSSNVMTLNFKSSASWSSDGFDLTITLRKQAMTLQVDGDDKYVNMLARSEATLNVSSENMSFKIYDDGGRDGDYSNNVNGTLVIRAPSGYIIELTGSVKTGAYEEQVCVSNDLWDGFAICNHYGVNYHCDVNDYLNVYDGANASATSLLKGMNGCSSGGPTWTSIGTIQSSGQVMTLNFKSDAARTRDGLDLTVTLRKQALTLQGEGDNKYVNMFTRSRGTLNVTSKDRHFKIYDDGGLNDYYNHNGNGSLVLTAPKGFTFMLTGSVKTGLASYRVDSTCTSWSSSICKAYRRTVTCTCDTNDYLRVFDGESNYYPSLLKPKYGCDTAYGSTWKSLDTIRSTGNIMSLYFYSNSTANAEGLDLDVSLVGYDVSIDSSTNGRIQSDKSFTFKSDAVTLTAYPKSDYMLKSAVVKDASGNILPSIAYTFTKSKFVMPASNVTVTPIFTNSFTAAGGLHLDMLRNTKVEVTIPSKVESFNVYDNGGKNGAYENMSNDTLVLKAPAGARMKLTGSISTEKSYDSLYVYDGANTKSQKLYGNSGVSNNIGTISSTGEYLTLVFTSNSFSSHDGLNLTVTLEQSLYAIDVNPISGGTLSVDGNKKADTLGAEIGLTGSTYLGYVSVVDKNNNSVSVNAYDFKHVKFKMPASDVSVTPEWATDLTAEGGLHIDMQHRSTVNLDIPQNVKSFKVYDNGGRDNDYRARSNDTLILNAPSGSYLTVTGSIMVGAKEDSLFIYEPLENGKLFKLYGGRNALVGLEAASIRNIKSLNNNLVIVFKSKGSLQSSGYDLTVSVVQSTSTAYRIDLIDDSEHGFVKLDKFEANQGDTVHLIWDSDPGYLLNSIQVAQNKYDEAEGNEKVIAGWFTPNNTATFVMPASDVLVIPSFTNNLTAEGDNPLYIDMLKSAVREVSIPDEVQSFKLVADGEYDKSRRIILSLVAPKGYVFELSGNATLEIGGAFVAYDGRVTVENQMFELTGSTNLPFVYSSGNVLNLRLLVEKNLATKVDLDLTVSLKKSISDMVVFGLGPQTYTGSEICPAVSVGKGNRRLEQNVDYKVECARNVSVGTASMRIIGIGQFVGTIRESFDIVPKPVSDLEVTYEANQPYTGSVICPAVTVKDGEKTLVLDTDYTVRCTESISLAGESANVVVFGAGNYSEQDTLPFTIVPKENKFASIQLFENQNGKWAVIDGNFNDNGVIHISEDILVNNVEFNRTFPVMKDVYSTVVLPFDVNTSQVTGPKQVLKFGGLQYVTENGVKKKAVVMNVVWDKDTSTTHADLAANTPYMVLMQDPTFDVTGAVTLKKTVLPIAREGDWELRGTLQYKKWYEGDPDLGRVYGFAAEKTSTSEIGQFVKAGAGAWIPPLRAYLIYNPQDTTQLCSVGSCRPAMPRVAVDASLPENIDVVIGGADGEQTTVIGRYNTRTGEFKANNRTFDLKGRNMTGKPKAKGVYLKKLK